MGVRVSPPLPPGRHSISTRFTLPPPQVAVDLTADELLSEGQLSRLRYVPAPSSHFLMEMLRRVTDTKMVCLCDHAPAK